MRYACLIFLRLFLGVWSLEAVADSDSDKFVTPPSYPGSTFNRVISINNLGQMVGFWAVPGPGYLKAYLYNGVAFENLWYPSALQTEPVRVTNNGDVYGNVTALASDGYYRIGMFRYNNGEYNRLPSYPGADDTWIVDVNDFGQIIGEWESDNGWGEFIYSDGVFASLPPFSGGEAIYPTSINDLGQIIGEWTDGTDGIRKAFIFFNGTYTVLPPNPAAPKGISVLKINNLGQILGLEINSSAKGYGAFIYSNGTYSHLPLYPENVQYEMIDLNDVGQVLGSWWTEAPPYTYGNFIYKIAPAAPQYTLSLSLSNSQVYPDNTNGDNETLVTATLSSTSLAVPISGKVITFSSVAKELTGGHTHLGGRPTGEFKTMSCLTDARGICSVSYYASEIGGIETLRGILSSDASVADSKDLIVSVPQLFEVADGNPFYRLTGQKPAHPSNHYISSSASGIYNVVSDFYDDFDATLGLNDMSLVSGGLFDIGPTYGNFWEAPHQSHRIGKSVDIDHCARDVTEANPLGQGVCTYYPQTKSCSSECEIIERNDIDYYCKKAGGHLVIEGNFHCEFN